MKNGGTWNTIAGQVTDDSELAILLARTLVKHDKYDVVATREAYLYWLGSAPFDCGRTVSSGLRGEQNKDSQSNGALMRISPLGIFGANYELSEVAEWAKMDACLTHAHPVCLEANSLFTMAIAHAVKTGTDSKSLYESIVSWANTMNVCPELMKTISDAKEAPPKDFTHQQGWVLIAFQNALWQLINAKSLEESIVETISCGGDTDTNAAICGALLGAVYGRGAIPEAWEDAIARCRPDLGFPGVHKPRPSCFWPGQVLELAEELIFQ